MQESYTANILSETVHLEESQFSKCFYCQQQFSNLEPPVVDHPGTKPFHCHECDIKLYKINHFINHITVHKIHSNSKPFNCSYCDEKFDNVAGFTEHVSTHVEAKPFKCPYCEESFDFENNLENHKIIHEKMANTLMKCESCEDQFLIENFVNAQPGMKPYTCEVCLEPFTDIIELCQHRAIIHTGYPYRCAQCRKANANKDKQHEQMDSSDTENLSQALNILGHQENTVIASVNAIGEARKKNTGQTRMHNSKVNNKSEKNQLSNDDNSPEDIKPDIIELNRDLENYSNNQAVCMDISQDFASEKVQQNGMMNVTVSSDLISHGNDSETCNINMDINQYSDIFNRTTDKISINSTQISLSNEIQPNLNNFQKKATHELEINASKPRGKRSTTMLNQTVDTSSAGNMIYTDSHQSDTNEEGRPFPVLCVRVPPTLSNDQSEISPSMILTDGPCSFRTSTMTTDINTVRPVTKNAARMSGNERRMRNPHYQMTRPPTTADYQLATSTTGTLGFSPLQRLPANAEFQLSTKSTNSFTNTSRVNPNSLQVTSPRRCHECDIWKKMITDTVSKLAAKEADCEVHVNRIQQLEQQLKESVNQVSTLNDALHSRSGDCQQYLQRIKQLEQQILQIMQQIPQQQPPPPQQQQQQQLQRQTVVDINPPQSSDPPRCGSPITYEFGRPRAGFGLSKTVVEKYKMIDIGQGLYVHPDDLAVVLSKADGQKMVRKLMNIVFKKEDLEQGATLSPTGKGKLLDQRTVDVMLAWVLMNQSTMWSRGSLRQAINRKLTSYRCRSLKKKLEAS